jgi:hypothetical protein
VVEAGGHRADLQRCARTALAAVDELKTKGSDSRRDLCFWGQVGVGAVALGLRLRRLRWDRSRRHSPA